jgi:hypothetical protein
MMIHEDDDDDNDDINADKTFLILTYLNTLVDLFVLFVHLGLLLRFTQLFLYRMFLS